MKWMLKINSPNCNLERKQPSGSMNLKSKKILLVSHDQGHLWPISLQDIHTFSFISQSRMKMTLSLLDIDTFSFIKNSWFVKSTSRLWLITVFSIFYGFLFYFNFIFLITVVKSKAISTWSMWLLLISHLFYLRCTEKVQLRF